MQDEQPNTQDEQPDRAERRRQEKELGKWNEAEWGPLAYREFHKCPHCGCEQRYTYEAFRGEIPEEKMISKPPALGAFEMVYETALHRITITVVVDSCCKCGMIIPVARSKKKTLLTARPMGGDLPGMGKRPPFLFRGR
jgi:hypothetical protein